MAWQNEQTLYVYSSNITLIGNISPSTITHSGSTLRVTGTVAVGARGNSGSYCYYNYGIMEKPGNGSFTKIVANNAQLKVGGSDYHTTFDVTITGVSPSATSYSFPVQFKACYNSDCSSTYWNVTKYWTLTFSASGSAPSGASSTYDSCTWNSMTATTTVTSTGDLSCTYDTAIVTGSYNGAADSITGWQGIGRIWTRSNSAGQVTVSDATKSGSADTPIAIKGLTHYKLASNVTNSAGNADYFDSTLRYLPPAPSQFTYTDPGGVGDKTFPVTFTGSTANNHTAYDSANLTRTIRYKIDNGNWVYVDNASVAALDFVTPFTVTVPAGSVATVEGWMTYHDMQSQVESFTLANTNAPVHLYGSVNGYSKGIQHLYGSVNGRSKKIKKLYASVGGVAKKVFVDE